MRLPHVAVLAPGREYSPGSRGIRASYPHKNRFGYVRGSLHPRKGSGLAYS